MDGVEDPRQAVLSWGWDASLANLGVVEPEKYGMVLDGLCLPMSVLGAQWFRLESLLPMTGFHDILDFHLDCGLVVYPAPHFGLYGYGLRRSVLQTQVVGLVDRNFEMSGESYALTLSCPHCPASYLFENPGSHRQLNWSRQI